jgi:hypothetical protein
MYVTTNNYPYGEHTQDDLIQFLEDDVLKFSEITTHEFLSLGCAGTFRYLGYYPQHRYGQHKGSENTDYWVRQALKLYDYSYYKTLHGKTKKPTLGNAYTRFLHFSRPTYAYDEGFVKGWTAEQSFFLQCCYENATIAAGKYLFKDKINDGFTKIDFDEAVLALPTNTSAGFSFPGKKKGEVSSEAKRRAKIMDWKIRNGQGSKAIPSTMALRGHLSPVHENKSRMIILYPYEIQILEARYFKKLYLQMKRVSPILSGQQSLQRLHRYLSQHQDMAYINTDISGWDRMRAIYLIRQAFKVFYHYLDLTDQDKKVVKWLENYLIMTPIMTPDGHLFRKKGGIPSGTFLTLLLNSACNYIAQHTLLNFMQVPYHDLAVLGDDCAFFMDVKYNWRAIFSRFCDLNMKVFCLRMNFEKSIYTTKLHERKFIGYQFEGLLLVRSTREWFENALYPESDVKSEAISFSRMFSYLSIGGINDTKFFDFFQFFLTCYQDSLRLWKKGLFRDRVFRFGSLRVFKDVLNFDLEQVINFDFDQFLKFDFYAMRFMFSLNVSINPNKGVIK